MFSKDEKKTKEDLTQTSNIIGIETQLKGDIESMGNIRIEGKVFGNTKAKAKLVMGKESYVDGNVIARTAEVAGKVKGNIEVSELLTLKPSAVIEGDILTNQLVVESGATFNGGCKMGHLAKEISIEQPQIRVPEKAIKRA